MRVMLSACLVLALAACASAAEPKATTDRLPAALKAIGGTKAQVLTSSEAKKIRGEGKGPGVKHPGNKYTGFRTGQNLGHGYGGLK